MSQGKDFLAGPCEYGEYLSLHSLSRGLVADSPAQENCEAEAYGPVITAGSSLCRILLHIFCKIKYNLKIPGQNPPFLLKVVVVTSYNLPVNEAGN